MATPLQCTAMISIFGCDLNWELTLGFGVWVFGLSLSLDLGAIVSIVGEGSCAQHLLTASSLLIDALP